MLIPLMNDKLVVTNISEIINEEESFIYSVLVRKPINNKIAETVTLLRLLNST